MKAVIPTFFCFYLLSSIIPHKRYAVSTIERGRTLRGGIILDNRPLAVVEALRRYLTSEGGVSEAVGLLCSVETGATLPSR